MGKTHKYCLQKDGVFPVVVFQPTKTNKEVILSEEKRGGV